MSRHRRPFTECLPSAPADSPRKVKPHLTGSRNPLHFDKDFGAGTRYGRRVVHGGPTTGLAMC